MITDPISGEIRPYYTREENGKTTKDHHQTWMGESKAELQCLFGEHVKDEVGICGVKLNTSENWIRSNIEKTVHNYDEIEVKAQNAMLKAHLTLS
jgi:hypothetical protein